MSVRPPGSARGSESSGKLRVAPGAASNPQFELAALVLAPESLAAGAYQVAVATHAAEHAVENIAPGQEAWARSGAAARRRTHRGIRGIGHADHKETIS